MGQGRNENDYPAPANIQTYLIHLDAETTCPVEATTCRTQTGGYAFWDVLPKDQCKFDRYGVLYEGKAEKLTRPSEGSHETIYTITADDVTFTLSQKRKSQTCGYTLIQTEHP